MPTSHRTHANARDFDAAMRSAAAVAEAAAGLRAAGFMPDLIIGHEGWGEMLNLADIWPDAPQIGFREYFYHLHGADVGFDPAFPLHPDQIGALRAKNAAGLLSLIQGRTGVSPTAWQRRLYPIWAQPSISLVPDGVDLTRCRPDPDAGLGLFTLGTVRVAPGTKLVTYVARDLEPYRGFHIFAHALPALLERRDVAVVCVGGDGVSYGVPPPGGTWRGRLIAELGDRVDHARLHFTGMLGYADYLRVLQRSDVHAYLSYPFIASWSLREALACGCAVLAGDTAPVREFITDGENGALVAPLDPGAVAAGILGLLDDTPRRAAISRAARARAEASLGLAGHLAAWEAVISAVLRGAR